MAKKPNLELYDPRKTYYAPVSTETDDGVRNSAAVYRKYPSARVVPHIVETDDTGTLFAGFLRLDAMAEQWGVDRTGLSDAEAVEAIREAIYRYQLAEEERAAAAAEESTAVERTAAALEALVMNSMATVNDDDPDAE